MASTRKPKDGYRVKRRVLKHGTSFTVEVWDPLTLKYASTKTFNSRHFDSVRDTERAATRWGDSEANLYRNGLGSSGFGIGIDTKKTFSLYVADKRRIGCTEDYVLKIEQRLRDLPEYCPDLSAEKVGQQIHAWWTDWCAAPAELNYQRVRSPSTCNKCLTDCKVFVKWCWDSRQLTGLKHPIDLGWIKRMKSGTKIKQQFTIDELRAGLQAVDDPYWLRWAVYIYTGLRASIALQIKEEDISNDVITVYGDKGDVDRMISLQPELKEILKSVTWHDGYLFPEDVRNTSWHVKAFNQFLERIGIERKGRTTHSLRHCFAGMLVASGASLRSVQIDMGHRRGDQTIHYAQLAAIYRSDAKDWPPGVLCLLNPPAKSGRT